MLPSDLSAVVQALREIQQHHDWTISTLSRKMGLSPSYISMILSGRRRPGFKFMRAAICAFPEIRALVTEHIVALSREPLRPSRRSACKGTASTDTALRRPLRG